MNSLAYLALAVVMQAPADAVQTQFFPGGGFSDFEANWYGEALTRMEEPPLAGSPRELKVFRFMLLPTWGHPVAVRLTIRDGQGTIEAKRLGGFGGYDPGMLVDSGSVSLSDAQVTAFLTLFGKLGFERLGTRDRERGKDGSEWILEAAENGSYHVVVRWSPRDGTAKRGLTDFVAACEWLFRTSPLTGDATNKSSIEISKKP